MPAQILSITPFFLSCCTSFGWCQPLLGWHSHGSQEWNLMGSKLVGISVEPLNLNYFHASCWDLLSDFWDWDKKCPCGTWDLGPDWIQKDGLKMQLKMWRDQLAVGWPFTRGSQQRREGSQVNTFQLLLPWVAQRHSFSLPPLQSRLAWQVNMLLSYQLCLLVAYCVVVVAVLQVVFNIFP